MLFFLQDVYQYVAKFSIPPFCDVKNAETAVSPRLHLKMREQINVVLKNIEEECKGLIKEG